MKRVSVIIPTINRVQLLTEAIGSVANQSHPDWEIIVVDDGSTSPLDQTLLNSAATREVTLLRNGSTLGQATSREIGERVATGEFLFHLDDDDLLAPDALERGISAFAQLPDVDVVFFNVKGFGVRSEAFELAQRKGLERVLAAAERRLSDDAVIRFGRSLFPALLASVPMAFQRPMATREAWRSITQLRRRSYDANHPLEPPLREAEWTLYAAATRRVALIADPLYLQRCDLQGYFSIAEKREMAERALLRIADGMLRSSATESVLSEWRSTIRNGAAHCYFDQAYAQFQRGARPNAIKYLLRAVTLRPHLAHLRLGLRLLLPRT